MPKVPDLADAVSHEPLFRRDYNCGGTGNALTHRLWDLRYLSIKALLDSVVDGDIVFDSAVFVGVAGIAGESATFFTNLHSTSSSTLRRAVTFCGVPVRLHAVIFSGVESVHLWSIVGGRKQTSLSRYVQRG